MKEAGKDHVQSFRSVSDGWHVIEFAQGIDLAKNKEGEISIDKNGNKSLFVPAIVNNADDPDNGINVNQRLNFGFHGEWLAGLLACVGLWEAVEKKYPGKNVSVFDTPIIEGIKARLPGNKCMARTEVDKDGYSKVREMASFVRYKELQAGDKTKAAGKKKGTSVTSVEEIKEEVSAGTGDGW